MVFYKKGILKIFRNVHRKTHELESKFSKVSGLPACKFIKKETLTQVLTGEYCNIFKNTFAKEHL